MVSGDTEQRPRAAFKLGLLRADSGPRDAAEQAYRIAVECAHPDFSPRAGVALGALLLADGDLVAAELAFRTVLASGRPTWLPRSVPAG